LNPAAAYNTQGLFVIENGRSLINVKTVIEKNPL